MRDALYARISEDDLGTEKGVTRQLEDGRALSAARDGQVAVEFSDNDLSALKGITRPGYESLMTAVDAGRVDRIVVFHTSRLWRNRRERAEGIERLRAAGVSVLAVKGPELDLSTAAGRMMAGILGEFDTAESEIKGERVARAALQRAYEGRANGAVLYGWRREYERDDAGRVIGFIDVVDEDEAAVVREIVDRLLAGGTLRGVTDDLNRREVPAPNGGPWGKTSVKKIAIRPANVALRLHHRERPDEALIAAAWPAIVDRDRHDRVVALLCDPRRRTVRPAARQHLLTWGIGECGVCGGRLRVSTKGNAQYGQKAQLYVCEAKGCVGRNRDRVDELVGRFVIGLFDRHDVADLLKVGDDEALGTAQDKRKAIRARLDRAADEYADGKIDSQQLRRITERLRPQLAQAEAEIRAARRSPHHELLEDMTDGRAETAWARLDLGGRRAVLEAIGARVLINPVHRRGPGFDPESVAIQPRGAG